MEISRRQKYSNGGRSAIKTDTRIPIAFDITALDLFCTYILSENRYIRTSHLINLRNLIAMLDTSLYINDPEKMKRLEFIHRGLDARIVLKLNNPMIILRHINGELESSLDTSTFPILSTEEIRWVDETVSESLKYSFMYSKVDILQDLCARFKAKDFRYRGDIVKEFESIVDELKTDFRHSKVESSSDITFSLRPGVYEEVVRDIHEYCCNPSRRLITGMQGLNELTGGGFESARCYLLFGLSGVGKSLCLLNLAMQIKKYNKGYKAKDPTKIPAVVILTMENSVQETVSRLFSMTTNDDIRNYSYEEAIEKLKTEGELYLTDESPIDIIIKYKPNRSVDTGYLYTLAEDLEDEGYEIICLIQDHIKRIRSTSQNADIRLELGEVVNEFKVFSILKDIPVISDSHLNRDAARTIDSGTKGNSQDMTRLLGRANVGESMLMIDNADCAFIINKDFDTDGNMYMVWSRIKMRDQCTSRDYIAHPFVKGSTITLLEDYYMPVPAFRESLHTPPNLINNTKVKRSDYGMHIEDLDADNIFNRIQNPDTSGILDIGNHIPEITGNRSEPIPFGAFNASSSYSSIMMPQMNIQPMIVNPPAQLVDAVMFMYGEDYIGYDNCEGDILDYIDMY